MKNTKTLIQDQLLTFMQTTDFSKIKVSHITSALNIHRSTFYLYYDSVYSVLQEIEDVYFDGLQDIVDHFWDYPLDRKYLTEPHPVLYDTMVYIKSHMHKAQALQGPHGDALYLAKCRRSIRESLFPLKLIKPFYPNTWECYTNFLLGGHLGMISHWLFHDCTTPLDEFTLLLYKLLYQDLLEKYNYYYQL